jgi:hypothetical protein
MAKTANTDPAYQARLGHFERLVATIPGLERKGAANPYTSLNGHMTACLHPPGVLALRLAPAEREAFLARYDSALFESYGVVQKEYVRVPDALLADTDQLAPWFRAGHDHVAAMKPKATTKPKK